MIKGIRVHSCCVVLSIMAACNDADTENMAQYIVTVYSGHTILASSKTMLGASLLF